jgi:hypothetical protein
MPSLLKHYFFNSLLSKSPATKAQKEANGVETVAELLPPTLKRKFLK